MAVSKEVSTQSTTTNSSKYSTVIVKIKYWQGGLVALFFAIILVLNHGLFLNVNADPRLVSQPWLLNNGFIQYQHIADEHTPLLPQLLAWTAPLFNNDHIVTLRVMHGAFIGTAVFLAVFWLYIRAGKWAAIAGGCYFFGWSNYFGYWGMWHNLALSPAYILFAILFFSSRLKKPVWYIPLLSLLIGTAFLLKQHAVLLVGVLVLSLVLQLAQKQMDGRTFIMRVGQLAIFTIVPLVGYTLYYLAQGGTAAALLYWPILYNFESGYNELGKLLPNSSDLLRMLPAFLLIIPFVASIFRRQTAKFWGSAREERVWFLLLLLVSMAFLYPRYSIPHWSVALPFMAVISAYSLDDLLRVPASGEARRVMRMLFAAILVWWTLQGILASWPYWVGSRTQVLLKYEPLIALAETLDDKLTTTGPITLLPDDESVSNLYYLLQRPPAFFWVMHYPWFVNEKTDKQWLEAVEAAQSQTVLFFDLPETFQNRSPAIYDYVVAHYELQETFEWNGRLVNIMQRVD